MNYGSGCSAWTKIRIRALSDTRSGSKFKQFLIWIWPYNPDPDEQPWFTTREDCIHQCVRSFISTSSNPDICSGGLHNQLMLINRVAAQTSTNQPTPYPPKYIPILDKPTHDKPAHAKPIHDKPTHEKTNSRQTYQRQINLRQTNPRQTNPRQSNQRQISPRQTNPQQTNPRQTNSRQTLPFPDKTSSPPLTHDKSIHGKPNNPTTRLFPATNPSQWGFCVELMWLAGVRLS